MACAVPPAYAGGGPSYGGTFAPPADVRLPPLRPASAEDIHAARQCLVLLKSKMPHRWRTPRERSEGPGHRCSSPSPREQGPQPLARSRSVPPRPGVGDALVRPAAGVQHEGRADALDCVQREGHTVPQGDSGGGHAHRKPPRSGRPPVATSPPLVTNSPVESPHGNSPRRSHPSGQQQPPQHEELPPTNSPYGDLDAFPTNEGPTGPLIKCEGCGRSFNADAFDKHSRICKKVFQDKRKKFNSAADRLGDLEGAKELIKGAQKIENEVKTKVSKADDSDKAPAPAQTGKPMPKWKKQSLEFRAAMLATKAAQGDEQAKVQAEALQDELGVAAASASPEDNGMKKCPHCGRTFNAEAAERHIAICQKTFGKPGGGRLVRGGGKSMLPARGAAAPGDVPASAAGAGGRATASDVPAKRVNSVPRTKGQPASCGAPPRGAAPAPAAPPRPDRQSSQEPRAHPGRERARVR